jgi:predicted nucleotide-binding protein
MGTAAILLADNMRDSLRSWSEVLRDAGFDVTEASSYSRAKELLEREKDKFDLAVLDLHLKSEAETDLSGIQLAEMFGSESFPIIILTGKPNVKAVKRALERDGRRHPPAVAFVEKRKGREVLLDAIVKVFVPRVFVAHGHDVKARDAVVEFLKGEGLHRVVLQEQTGATQTIIEKFEEHSRVHFAIVLVTPDDVGGKREKQPKLRPRARQNVVFELGYFLGRLGRDRVVVLYKDEGDPIEPPSNYDGVQYLTMDSGGGWQVALVRELRKAGIRVHL